MSSMPPASGPSYGEGGPPSSGGAGGFFSALFDFSFNEFITPKVVKVVYVLATVALGLLWLVLVISAFVKSAGAGITVLVIGGILAILYLALVRMTLEFYLAIVRMSEDIHHRLPPR